MEWKTAALPSLILDTPGCCAWEEIGALLAGVFCGVLDQKVSRNLSLSKIKSCQRESESIRCDRKIRLLIPDGLSHGDVDWIKEGRRGRGVVRGEKKKERGRIWHALKREFLGERESGRWWDSLVPVVGGAWRDAVLVECKSALPTTSLFVHFLSFFSALNLYYTSLICSLYIQNRTMRFI